MGARVEALATLRTVTADDLWGTLAALFCFALQGQTSDVERLVHEDSVRNIGLVDDQLGWTLAQTLATVGAHDEAMWWLRHSGRCQ
jgi:hypothetical protein